MQPRNVEKQVGASGQPVARRWLLRWSVMGGLAALLAELGGLLTSFLWPSRVGAFGGKVLAGRPEDLRLGVPTYVRDGKFYLIRVPEGILAFYQKCPHLGCVVPWRPDHPSEDSLAPTGRFNCPCHSSIYDRYGLVKDGPAPRPLDIMRIDLVDGQLVVDTADVRQRSSFDPDQALKT